jgi:hypothetical protein
LTIDRTAIHTRVAELIDLLLDAAAQTSPATEQSTGTAPNMEESAEAAKRFFAPYTGAEAVDYDAMTDEELLKSDVGTRVREILFRQLDVQGKEFYANARLKGSGSTMLAGITLARDWIFPEDTWAYGFRDAAEWEPTPYEPTDKDRAELMRRIAARDYKVEREDVEALAMQIAEENGWCAEEDAAEEAARQAEAPEAKEWGIVQLSHRTQNPLRRATIHKAPCAALAKAVKDKKAKERTLDDLWQSVRRGYYADGPEPPTDLTTVYTLCSSCGANKALQQALGEEFVAWTKGERLR